MTLRQPSTLIVVPTPLEHEQLEPRLSSVVDGEQVVFEVCGFGPIAAAARTMQLIASLDPLQVILVGIAGAFGDETKIGTATCFRRVACDGIGVGMREDFVSASAIGWNQWMSAVDETNPQSHAIGDQIELPCRSHDGFEVSTELLTVCAASAKASEADLRRQRYPQAVAEDMEGFGVAMACRLAGVPLQIVRGLSNRAGDRDKANWEIKASLEAASELALKILST